MKTGMRIEGFVDADRNLAALEELANADDLRGLGIEALWPVAQEARGLVRHRTGRLMRSIEVGTQLSPTQAARVSPHPGTVEVYVGPGSMAQAITEEFGTVVQSAHPYMRPAWDTRVGEVIARLRAGAGRRLKRIVKG